MFEFLQALRLYTLPNTLLLTQENLPLIKEFFCEGVLAVLNLFANFGEI